MAAADKVAGAPRLDRDPAGPPPAYDPAIEPAIRALLDQHADIQAKLAALLPQKYGPNVRVELDNLRHKLRVLRTYASEHRKHRARILLCYCRVCSIFASALFPSSPGVVPSLGTCDPRPAWL